MTQLSSSSTWFHKKLFPALWFGFLGKFGNEITFTPVTEFTLNPFAKNAVAEQLILRTHQARIGKSG